MPEGKETKEGCKACDCKACIEAATLYWCETCRQSFDSKRCPQCGQKLKKMKT